jgi:hypothetical protein
VSSAVLTPAEVPESRRAPTYGELIHVSRTLAEQACSTGCGPFTTAGQALSAAVNYERFLAVAGNHLRLLATPGYSDIAGQRNAPSPLHELVQRLTNLDLAHGEDNVWDRAATRLSAAHDLLATHVGSVGELRTPEARLLEHAAVRRAAAGRILDLISGPVERCSSLLAQAHDARRRDPDATGVTRARAAHLRQAVNAVHHLVTDLRSELTESPNIHALDDLDTLRPALSRIAERPAARFDTSLDALRTLRLLSYRQFLGEEPASPGCLHDLSRLAVVTSRTAEGWLPESATPLARVQHAVTRDELDAARIAWESAAASLRQHVRGLSKAPRVYADAVRTTIAAVPHSPSLGHAVMAALPRLGQDAGATVMRLAETGNLVIAIKEVGRFQASWRLLEPRAARDIAELFAAAGEASHRAQTTYLHTQRVGANVQPQLSQRPTVVRGRELTAPGKSL